MLLVSRALIVLAVWTAQSGPTAETVTTAPLRPPPSPQTGDWDDEQREIDLELMHPSIAVKAIRIRRYDSDDTNDTFRPVGPWFTVPIRGETAVINEIRRSIYDDLGCQFQLEASITVSGAPEVISRDRVNLCGLYRWEIDLTENRLIDRKEEDSASPSSR